MTDQNEETGKKKRFSLFGDLRQRAAGSREKRRESTLDIRVIRGEEGVAEPHLPPPPPAAKRKKPSRATVSFSCNIFPKDSEDFAEAMAECKQMVLEAGGTILAATYPGGFLYDLSFANSFNPLDSLDETAGGGFIVIMPYEASITPHVHPLRAHPIRPSEGLEASVVEHMSRFGLHPNPHPCNGRDKVCIPSCEYRRTARQRPVSVNARIWEDIITALVSDSPPQLQPTKRNSLIRMEDIFESAEPVAAQTMLSTQRLKRNSRNLSRMIERDDTLTWLEDQETVRQFRREQDDGKTFKDEQEVETGKRPRPTPIFGTVENNHYVATRPPIPRRSSSLKQYHQASSREHSQEIRRDSAVAAANVRLPSSPILRPRGPLRAVEPYSTASVTIPNQPPISPYSDNAASLMYSELSSDNIRNLQKKLSDIREGLGGA